MYTIPFLTAKLVDIGFVTVYYFAAAFVLSSLLNWWMGPFDEETQKQKSIVLLLGEVILQFFVLGVLTFIMRNIVERVPFPFEGLGGFRHSRLKEVDDAGVFIIVFLFYQEHLALTLKHLATRISSDPRARSGQEDSGARSGQEDPSRRSGLGKFI
jgi:hypothetical protein